MNAQSRSLHFEAAIAVARVRERRLPIADAYGLDRFWRNARVHSLHDSMLWKFHHIGNFYLNGLKPPRQGAI